MDRKDRNLGGFILGGMYYGTTLVEPCPPTTQVNVDQKIKGKKGAVISSNLATTVDSSIDCSEVIRGMSMKEIRAIRKE